MLPELGLLALLASFAFALLLLTVPWMGVVRGQDKWMQHAFYYATAQWLCVGLSFLCLMGCFLLNDFSVWYVRMNSSVALPWFYKACAVWGGHEGSMLLWICLLQTWTVAVARYSQGLPLLMRARMLVVLGGVSAGFLLFILSSSNPFIRVFDGLVTQGRDLNPLLQDPGFLFHPPMLYMGYVGGSVAFAFAIATLWAGEFQPALAQWTRMWVLASWCCLTLGVTLGSWWAYRELGWGGYWFWDPVENASFMPWLVSTALIHALPVAQKKQILIGWGLLLSIVAFVLSLVGTFLVRSGVLTSVHAFAVDPTRGLFILGMLGCVMLGSFSLYACRVQTVLTRTTFPLLSREMLLLLNGVFLVIGMSTVLLGTIYPLIVEGLGLGKLSVGAPYFNSVWIPLMFPLFALMGFAWTVKWGTASSWQSVWQSSVWALLLSIGVSVWAVYFLSGTGWQSLAGIGLAVWMGVTTLQGMWKKKTHLGGHIAHLGIAVSVLGVAVSAGLGTQLDEVLKLGQRIPFAGYQLTFKALSPLTGPNYHGLQATMHIKGPHTDTNIFPEKRIYEVNNTPMTDAAIDVTVLRDVYVALGEPVAENTWSMRLYYKPGVRWIWLGGWMMVLGGGMALFRQIGRRKQSRSMAAC